MFDTDLQFASWITQHLTQDHVVAGILTVDENAVDTGYRYGLAADYDPAETQVLKHEGGYTNDAADPGGPGQAARRRARRPLPPPRRPAAPPGEGPAR